MGPLETLPCPRCGRNAPKTEWRLLYRRIIGAGGRPPARLLEHLPCEQIVYFPLN
jgi:hypothetical protein